MSSAFAQAATLPTIQPLMKQISDSEVTNRYRAAREAYAAMGIDTDVALKAADEVRLSHPCWAIDSVGGYEVPDPNASANDVGTAGIQPPCRVSGMPRNLEEHLADLKEVVRVIPGPNAILVHNIYADTAGEYVERNEHGPEHFKGWMEWAKETGVHLHMNPSPFRHRMATTGFTLASSDKEVRAYWIQEALQTRKIAQAMAEAQNAECVHNIWIPDGYGDNRVDRSGPRELLQQSLEECVLKVSLPRVADAIEGKLFGIGFEDYQAGHHLFYRDFASRHGLVLCVDTGHFTNISPDEFRDIVGTALLRGSGIRGVLLHVSFPNKWDSDFTVRTTDWLNGLADEIKRSDSAKPVYFGNDFFQPGAQPLVSLALGGRATRKAILWSHLDPCASLMEAEGAGCDMVKLAIEERRRELPFGAVWDMYCLQHNVPVGLRVLDELRSYEESVMAKRD